MRSCLAGRWDWGASEDGFQRDAIPPYARGSNVWCRPRVRLLAHQQGQIGAVQGRRRHRPVLRR